VGEDTINAEAKIAVVAAPPPSRFCHFGGAVISFRIRRGIINDVAAGPYLIVIIDV